VGKIEHLIGCHRVFDPKKVSRLGWWRLSNG
jgi:hypothetical protein